MKLSEQRARVEDALRAHPERADLWHAEELDVDPGTIARARRRLEAEGVVPAVAAVERRNGQGRYPARRTRPWPPAAGAEDTPDAGGIPAG